MRVELLAITPNAEELIARAARISHRSEDKASPEADRELIKKLIRLGHESVLEHASATFLIEGISRSCLAQLTRHRLASFTVESMRYCDVTDNGVVVPPTITGNAQDKFARITDEAVNAYMELVSMGVPREDARFVLPLGTTTRLIMTANFRELRHIIRLRGKRAAQWEIRQLVAEILRILQAHAPTVFGDLMVEEG